MAQKISINNEEGLNKLEENVQMITNQLRDWVVAKKVQEQLEEEQFRSRCLALVKGTGKSLVNKGLVNIQVRFAGGTVVALRTAHGSRKSSAGKKGKGLYPGLYLLGIHDHCTPFLASEIAQMCAALCSIEEAQNMLEARGCFLNTKSIRNIMKRLAARARAECGKKARPRDLRQQLKRVRNSRDNLKNINREIVHKQAGILLTEVVEF